jgi:hypothetical protein
MTADVSNTITFSIYNGTGATPGTVPTGATNRLHTTTITPTVPDILQTAIIIPDPYIFTNPGTSRPIRFVISISDSHTSLTTIYSIGCGITQNAFF